MDTAALLLELARARPTTLGTGRLLCIDGPAGSGKTMLAAAVADLEPTARVVHMDDLYDGWDGLPRVTDQLDALLLPLARGEAGHHRRYDWGSGRYAETVTVPPGPLLVLEGVGSGSPGHARLSTLTVWVSAPEELRLRRGLARDGAALRDHWVRWARDEQRHFARAGTAERADVVVDGTGLAPPWVRGPRETTPGGPVREP